ncbi:hypothetical protein [Flavobacterium daemonense]|uniref:hypothetical protein n=1 Tax=Flavobacterium daemonense TaxID=1393049 RepID=UPI0011862AC1|nr:hypothetical protein [Flavobacterium daemonense]KAF2334840.1 hypothetical protein FND99_06415 [Flavobacterium daemonense]
MKTQEFNNLASQMENNNWWGNSFLGKDFEKKFEEYTKKKVEKRTEDADFFLDILIEQGIIKLSKEKVKDYFTKWFLENKEFDLQIKDGDLAIEDGDLKFVPDFNKDDIVGFINWFENEKTEFIDYLKTKGVKIDNEKDLEIKNSGNLIINNNSNVHNQSIANSDKKKKWEKGTIISLIGLIIAFTVLLFGNNLVSRFSDDSKSQKQLLKESNKDIIVKTFNLPYLENYPILDKGLFLKYYFNSLIVGGANIDGIKINTRGKNGNKLEINRETSDNNYEIDINEEPYIEIEYKKKFYSIEITGQHYSFLCKINEIKNPTLDL